MKPLCVGSLPPSVRFSSLRLMAWSRRCTGCSVWSRTLNTNSGLNLAPGQKLWQAGKDSRLFCVRAPHTYWHSKSRLIFCHFFLRRGLVKSVFITISIQILRNNICIGPLLGHTCLFEICRLKGTKHHVEKQLNKR